MNRLPILSGKKLISLLTKKGFLVVRQKGSHVFIRDDNRRKGTIVPVHRNEDLGRGLLKSILDDLDISVEDLMDKR